MAVTRKQMDGLAVLRADLERRRLELASEISGYPSPIAGCDAQFNALLEERNRVLQALRVLDKAADDPTMDLSTFTQSAKWDTSAQDT